VEKEGGQWADRNRENRKKRRRLARAETYLEENVKRAGVHIASRRSKGEKREKKVREESRLQKINQKAKQGEKEGRGKSCAGARR